MMLPIDHSENHTPDDWEDDGLEYWDPVEYARLAIEALPEDLRCEATRMEDIPAEHRSRTGNVILGAEYTEEDFRRQWHYFKQPYIRGAHIYLLGCHPEGASQPGYYSPEFLIVPYNAEEWEASRADEYREAWESWPERPKQLDLMQACE